VRWCSILAGVVRVCFRFLKTSMLFCTILSSSDDKQPSYPHIFESPDENWARVIGLGEWNGPAESLVMLPR